MVASLLSLKNTRKALLFAAAILASYIIILLLFKHFDISRDKIQQLIGPLGPIGLPLAFVIQILAALTPIPEALFALTVMVIYGPVAGSIVIFGGLLVGAMINYGIAKRFGKKFIVKHFPETAEMLEGMNSHISVEGLIVLRYFSLVTFDVVSYLAAFSDIPFYKFFLSALVGLVPIVLSDALVAQGLFANNPFELLLSWGIPAVTAFVFAYFARISKIRIKKH